MNEKTELKQPLYVWRDSKANRFSSPMVYTNEACAIRDFEMQVKQAGTVMGFAPGDYDLYFVGWYDVHSAIFDTCVPEFVVNGGNL